MKVRLGFEIVIFLLLAVLLAGVVYLRFFPPELAPAAPEETAAPTAEPTAEPTDAPTPEPTAEPTPAPTPFRHTARSEAAGPRSTA